MLSNPQPPAGGLHARQRHQHRRQNSTPTAFEAMKIAAGATMSLPNFHHHQQQQQQQQQGHEQPRPPVSSSHRRGLSLDTRRAQVGPATRATTTTRQDFTTVSSTTTCTTNNTGLAMTPQHILREAQQQRIARPAPPQQQQQQQQQQQPQQQRRRQLHSRHHSIISIGNSSDDGNNGSNSHHSPYHSNSNNHMAAADSDSFLLSPHGTPHSQRFIDAMPDLSVPLDVFLGEDAASSRRNSHQLCLASGGGDGFDQFFSSEPDSALSTPTFMTFPEAVPAEQPGWISDSEATSEGMGHGRRTSRRISNGILEKVARFEALAGGGNNGGGDGGALECGISVPQRPATPPNQNSNAYFPPTPIETPHNRTMKHGVAAVEQTTQLMRPNRFSDDYDESMEETIKPTRGGNNANGRSAKQSSGLFAELRQQAEELMCRPTPPARANTLPMGFPPNQQSSTPDFMSMSNVNAEFVKLEQEGFDAQLFGHISPPELARHDAFEDKPDLQPETDLDTAQRMGVSPLRPNHHHHQQQQQHPHMTPLLATASSSRASSRRTSPHRHTESVASITSAASIASISIEETRTETGVTLDDITAFIEGPDPADGKWICRYESCGKRFGRKENIKSHVQTHLNDRQYRCPTCQKCFVRQHDLKRHAKIHTGLKPYPCECGNSFARHDALTRHRQRGMCIGAFDGVVRKVVKRGRPRKNQRPDLDERREKSERTRRKNRAQQHYQQNQQDAEGEGAERTGGLGATSISSQSSQSGYSDSSAANSPMAGSLHDDLDAMLEIDDGPFPDMLDVAMAELPTGSAPTGGGVLATVPQEGGQQGNYLRHNHNHNHNHRHAAAAVATASPDTMSSHSHMSHASLGGEVALPTTIEPHHLPLCTGAVSAESPAAKSVASHYTHMPGTPPELSACGSPPATGVSSRNANSGNGSGPRFFELSSTSSMSDPNSSGLMSDTSIGLGTTMAAHAAAAAAGSGSMGVSVSIGAGVGIDVDDDLLCLQAYTHSVEDGLVPLATVGGKYDDDFDTAVSMFTNGDDVFFGSS